ncbi:uncharacterized protein LAJ45_00982 [Morchella importuna]|uniref:uncharacterized protein n=1 Tax=Morchella importuna TaxID=1174673 RepID=UPI001E8E8988|nr:uncharacterized protein LAJ45_00982 [Morchella importuna]KAH8154455.1 hypothetical protein LAJ45_00982 [Morchella importuna]
MGENSVVNKTNPAGHQDSEIDASSQYEGNEANFLEIPMNDNAITEEVEEINLDNLIPGESLVGIPRMFISTDVPLKLDFFFYDIEDPTYHLAPKCNDRLLDCFRFIAQQNGTHIFCYCMSQGNGRFERLTQGHFGCGKIWMDIKRYLEQEVGDDLIGIFIAHMSTALVYPRRKASRMFAKYFRRDGFLREHYILSHEYLFIHTPAWGRVRHCTESEYEPNDVKFFSDKATQIINGVTVEIGMLKFKMFDADVEDPAGILENKRFLLGKSVRTMKNKKNLSQGSRKKMIAAEEKFLEVEKRMADPNIIT